MDFITSVGNKILLTAAAEQQAKTGHDVMTFRDWSVQNHGESLEPLDDVMKALTGRYGPVNPISTYLGTVNGHWVGLPTAPAPTTRDRSDGSACCATRRASMSPRLSDTAGATKLADEWTYEAI